MRVRDHKVHPSVVEAAAAVYAECFSPDGKPAHRALARQMEATIERVIGVTALHNERIELARDMAKWSKELVATFDRVFPGVTITRWIK